MTCCRCRLMTNSEKSIPTASPIIVARIGAVLDSVITGVRASRPGWSPPPRRRRTGEAGDRHRGTEADQQDQEGNDDPDQAGVGLGAGLGYLSAEVDRDPCLTCRSLRSSARVASTA